MKRTVVALLALVTTVAAISGGTAVADDGAHGSPKSTIAVYGDSPYGTCSTKGTPTCADTAQFDATNKFVDTINGDPDVSLVLHVGDIHSGKQFCTETYDQAIYSKWTRFVDPLVYTPGDNEWTDCHKTAEGGDVFTDPPANSRSPVDYANGDPVANLALIRSIFFPQPGVTLGTHKRLVLSQKYLYDRRFPTDAKYAENVIWVQSDVLFVTINVPGGSNNDTDVWYNPDADQQPDAQHAGPDRRARAAHRRRPALARPGLRCSPSSARVKGVVIGAQADMWDPEKADAVHGTHQEGYEPIVAQASRRTRSTSAGPC